MVIQRWQSMLLFIAVVLMGIFSVSDYVRFDSPQLLPTDIFDSGNMCYRFLNVLIAAVLFVSIFLFKKLNLQKCFVFIACAMMVVSAIWGWYKINRFVAEIPGCDVFHFTASWILLIAAFVLSLISLFFIQADRNLLKSYDRLR